MQGIAEEFGFADLPIVVVLAAGELKRELYTQQFPNEEYPGDDAFRAFFDVPSSKVVIFLDGETFESVLWIFVHEMTHVILHQRAPLLDWYLGTLRYEWLLELGIDPEAWKHDKNLQLRDEIHENDPEESLCNRVATAVMGGADYSRTWWRRHRQEARLTPRPQARRARV